MKRQVRSARRVTIADIGRIQLIGLIALAGIVAYLLYTFIVATRGYANAPSTTKLAILAGAVIAGALLAALVRWSPLFLAILVFPLIGGLLRNSTGTYLGIVGALFWLFGAVFAALLGLAYYARFILPLRGSQGNSQAMDLLSRYALRDFMPLPKYKVTVSGVPSSFEQFGVGLVESHEVVALTRGVEFRRGVGPGFVRLASDETVTDKVDLRLHRRTASVSAVTRDGIPVTTEVTVWFRVRPPAWEREPRLPYPYDERSIFDVFYARTLTNEERELAWDDRVLPQAVSMTVAELARVQLDGLYRVNNLDVDPLLDLAENVQHNLFDEFERQGVSIVDVALAAIAVPEGVMAQRLAQWQAGWQARIRERREAYLGREIGRIDRETAQIQMEVVSELVDNIELLRRSSDHPINQSIASRLMRLLEDAAAEGVMRTLIPPPEGDA
ncbi:MAG: SPFH domain-containing protein [Anaerolineae bacterium]|nr:SPFH domain-containing protein [Anaerolineae bacterium]